MSPKKGPVQKEGSLPTTIFQGTCWFVQGSTEIPTMLVPWPSWPEKNMMEYLPAHRPSHLHLTVYPLCRQQLKHVETLQKSHDAAKPGNYLRLARRQNRLFETKVSRKKMIGSKFALTYLATLHMFSVHGLLHATAHVSVHCVNISVKHIEPMGSSRRLGEPTTYTLKYWKIHSESQDHPRTILCKLHGILAPSFFCLAGTLTVSLKQFC